MGRNYKNERLEGDFETVFRVPYKNSLSYQIIRCLNPSRKKLSLSVDGNLRRRKEDPAVPISSRSFLIRRRVVFAAVSSFSLPAVPISSRYFLIRQSRASLSDSRLFLRFRRVFPASLELSSSDLELSSSDLELPLRFSAVLWFSNVFPASIDLSSSDLELSSSDLELSSLDLEMSL